ncbi:ABC transporter permease [Actinomyces sp. MRS3W]|uniref:ABC transporter permease n=1 Tax=Actinomyces sp. MRS3W TaxID=2800796 RepID=UPI0028FD026D|nr:ABC transporter [Actinomyces sp. MRS3W]MDU0347924.1 ABC transporter [Actinomyces sp. MRS3W]
MRVTWASSTAFATVGTAVVTLLLLPLLNIAYDVLLGADLSAPDLVRTGYAAALVALASSVCAGVVGTVATDRNLGVFQEVHMRRRIDPAYWLAVAVVPALLAVLTGAAAIGAVFLLSPGHDSAMLLRVIAFAPIAVVCGLLLGVSAAGIGVDLPDPYLGATIVSTFLPLLTGVIVPLSVCPGWLRILAGFAPVSGTVTALDAATGDIAPMLVHDLLVALVWSAVGLVATRHAITRLRAGLRRDVV